MNKEVLAAVFATSLLVGMVIFMEIGRHLGQRRASKDAEGAKAGLGVVEGAVFALMGLLVAFTFSGAASRFDSRRTLIIEEANAIGTAWLRLDLLPASAQPELRDLFRSYLDARLSVYRKLPDIEAARGELAKASALQNGIWNRAMAACRESASPLTAQMIPALNQMFDIASSRSAVSQIHPPAIIFIMLGVLALTSSMLAGFAMAGGKSRSWIHMIGFSLILAMTVYVILDLEFPRLGFIRVDSFDALLVELRQSMNPAN